MMRRLLKKLVPQGSRTRNVEPRLLPHRDFEVELRESLPPEIAKKLSYAEPDRGAHYSETRDYACGQALGSMLGNAPYFERRAILNAMFKSGEPEDRAIALNGLLSKASLNKEEALPFIDETLKAFADTPHLNNQAVHVAGENLSSMRAHARSFSPKIDEMLTKRPDLYSQKIFVDLTSPDNISGAIQHAFKITDHKTRAEAINNFSETILDSKLREKMASGLLTTAKAANQIWIASLALSSLAKINHDVSDRHISEVAGAIQSNEHLKRGFEDWLGRRRNIPSPNDVGLADEKRMEGENQFIERLSTAIEREQERGRGRTFGRG